MNSKCALKNLQEFMEAEARSGSMDLTLSKSLTLFKAQVNLAFLSLNRDCWMCNTSVCVSDVGRQRCDRRNRNGTEGITEERNTYGSLMSKAAKPSAWLMVQGS